MTPTNERVSLADIQPHKRNYNRHPASQIERIATSLRKFGQVRSIVVWRNIILAGHGVVEAARSLGWTEITADVLPADYPEHLALAYVAADNELGRLADPDLAALAAILEESKAHDAELLEAIGYSDFEFIGLLGKIAGEFDIDQEWQGMPEFNQEDEGEAVATISVMFFSLDDIKLFAKALNQDIRVNTKSIWYPNQLGKPKEYAVQTD